MTHKTPWTDIHEGLRREIPFLVTEKDMQQFASLSGDLNPVHLDSTYAKAHGFQGGVVYGALLIAGISRFVGMELPGPGAVWHRLAIDFKAPLYADQPARIVGEVTYVNPDLRLLRMKLVVKEGERTIANAEVQAGGLPQ